MPALRSLPPANLPAPREAAHSMAVGNKIGRKQQRSLMQAANHSRLEATWTSTPETADSIIFKNLRTLVARSRSEFLINDYCKHFVRIVRKNVVGPHGIALRSTPRGTDGKIDIPAKDAIEEAWKFQSRAGNWDVTGAMSRAAFEQQWISTVATDGEAFALIVIGGDAGPTGFALQTIDSQRIDPAHNEPLADGRFIRAGIEYNKFGRPIAYHVADDLPEIYSAFPATRRERIEADRMIHGFIPELAGQKRGIPWMHTALWRLRNVKGFEDAAVINARVGAAKMGFFADKDDEEGDETDDIPEEGEDGSGQSRHDDLIIDAEPGTFQDIGRREFKEFNPQFPETSTGPFIKGQLRGAASGLGVNYNTLSNDLESVNFSSLRLGLIDERDTWQMIQEWMIGNFEVRVFEAWMDFALLKGTIKVKDRPLRADRRDKYRAALFRGRRWAWVDPKAEMAAAKIAIDSRIASRTSFIEDHGSGPAWDTFEEMAQEEQDMKELGVSIPTTPGAGVMGTGTTPPTDDDDNDETDA